jgi:hypothetical protein
MSIKLLLELRHVKDWIPVSHIDMKMLYARKTIVQYLRDKINKFFMEMLN